MNENEQKTGSVADQKSKIRERYKGIDPDELDVIPALPQEDIFAVENEQRVAVYARVSTDDPRQTSSYELQKNHYHDVISKSPNWKLVQIYADEGISGTSLQHRDQFKLMIEDCKKGQIDLIVTKSVLRHTGIHLEDNHSYRIYGALNPKECLASFSMNESPSGTLYPIRNISATSHSIM